VDREPGGVEGLEELDERLAHPLRVRQPGHRVASCVTQLTSRKSSVGHA
jgi:hypothetical protein